MEFMPAGLDDAAFKAFSLRFLNPDPKLLTQQIAEPGDRLDRPRALIR